MGLNTCRNHAIGNQELYQITSCIWHCVRSKGNYKWVFQELVSVNHDPWLLCKHGDLILPCSLFYPHRKAKNEWQARRKGRGANCLLLQMCLRKKASYCHYFCGSIHSHAHFWFPYTRTYTVLISATSCYRKPKRSGFLQAFWEPGLSGLPSPVDTLWDPAQTASSGPS